MDIKASLVVRRRIVEKKNDQMGWKELAANILFINEPLNSLMLYIQIQ